MYCGSVPCSKTVLISRLTHAEGTMRCWAQWLSGARGLHYHESLPLQSRYVASARGYRTRHLVYENGRFTADGLRVVCKS